MSLKICKLFPSYFSPSYYLEQRREKIICITFKQDLFELKQKVVNDTKEGEFIGKQISLKEIPSGIGEPLKETKYRLEDENNKQVRMSTGDPLKKKYMV